MFNHLLHLLKALLIVKYIYFMWKQITVPVSEENDSNWSTQTETTNVKCAPVQEKTEQNSTFLRNTYTFQWNTDVKPDLTRPKVQHFQWIKYMSHTDYSYDTFIVLVLSFLQFDSPCFHNMEEIFFKISPCGCDNIEDFS